jgi:FkbM family methyltransferase
MADFLRTLKNLRYRMFYGALSRRGYPLMELGSRANPWFLCPTGLGAQSIVYSGGVGRDITFEHALVKNYGCNIVLFDPSPTGRATMSLPENKIPQFNFHPLALAGQCGTLNLSRPLCDEDGSWFKTSKGGTDLEVCCVDLASLMEKNGHRHIDLLKIDIEGAEYEVIEDFLRRQIPIRQVLVEFHNKLLPGIHRKQTVRAILKLAMGGYRLIKKDLENHSFLNPRRL